MKNKTKLIEQHPCMYLSALSQICTSFALKPCDQQTWDCTREEILSKRLGSYMCVHNHIMHLSVVVTNQLDNHLLFQKHLSVVVIT
jgi:hypothetical protein